MPLLVPGFSVGTSDSGNVDKSLEDIMAARRKEQAEAASGRKKNQTKTAKAKKSAMADRSVATGRAKRAAAARARRGLTTEKKPSAMEVEKEVYRQARTTAASQKAKEKKAANGRLPPNSSLRDKNLKSKKATKKQLQAAIKGMELAGCPVPKGFELFMEFSPEAAKKATPKKQTNANNKNAKTKNANNNSNNKKNTNKNNNKNNNNSNQKTGGRKGGRGRN